MASEDYPDLELREDERVTRFSWVGQLVQHALLAVVLVAGLLGVFGGGPVSTTRAAQGGLAVAYERFQRVERPEQLVVDAPASAGSAMVAFDRGLLADWYIESVSPEPTGVSQEGSSIRYSFAADRRARVAFRLVPHRPGVHSMSVSSGDDALRVSVLVYP